MFKYFCRWLLYVRSFRRRDFSLLATASLISFDGLARELISGSDFRIASNLHRDDFSGYVANALGSNDAVWSGDGDRSPYMKSVFGR